MLRNELPDEYFIFWINDGLHLHQDGDKLTFAMFTSLKDAEELLEENPEKGSAKVVGVDLPTMEKILRAVAECDVDQIILLQHISGDQWSRKILDLSGPFAWNFAWNWQLN